MSATDKQEKYEELQEKSSGSEGDYQTEDEADSEESVTESIIKLKNVTIGKTRRKSNSTRKNDAKGHGCRLNVSQKFSKHNRQRAEFRNKSAKYVKRKSGKKCTVRSQNLVEHTAEFPKKGKRCRLGGKAKAVQRMEETRDKCDSDEENDNCYFRRISLGYFQQYKDNSGASTSYQLNEGCISSTDLLPDTTELTGKTSEEQELLELQQWGRSSLVASCNKTNEKLNKTEDIGPETF